MPYIILFSLLIGTAFAADSFFVNQSVIDQYPGAFAIEREALPFLRAVDRDRSSTIVGSHLVQDQELTQRLQDFDDLDLDTQVEVLKDLFHFQVQQLKIDAPKLVIDETSIPGSAFFEFDLNRPGAGIVYINKRKLRESKAKKDFIVLLLHETRHSAQFQIMQKERTSAGRGYAAAFKAQSAMKKSGQKVSFCDFMLLKNEYEAFLFANDVLAHIEGHSGKITSNGTLASQFKANGLRQLNLTRLLERSAAPVKDFNEISKIQKEEL